MLRTEQELKSELVTLPKPSLEMLNGYLRYSNFEGLDKDTSKQIKKAKNTDQIKLIIRKHFLSEGFVPWKGVKESLRKFGWKNGSIENALTVLELIDYHIPFPYGEMSQFDYDSWKPKAYYGNKDRPYYNPAVDIRLPNGNKKKRNLNELTSVKYENMPTSKAVEQGIFEYYRPDLIGWLTLYVNEEKLKKVLDQYEHRYYAPVVESPSKSQPEPTLKVKPSSTNVLQMLSTLNDSDSVSLVKVSGKTVEVVWQGEVGNMPRRILGQQLTHSQMVSFDGMHKVLIYL